MSWGTIYNINVTFDKCLANEMIDSQMDDIWNRIVGAVSMTPIVTDNDPSIWINWANDFVKTSKDKVKELCHKINKFQIYDEVTDFMKEDIIFEDDVKVEMSYHGYCRSIHKDDIESEYEINQKIINDLWNKVLSEICLTPVIKKDDEDNEIQCSDWVISFVNDVREQILEYELKDCEFELCLSAMEINPDSVKDV